MTGDTLRDGMQAHLDNLTKPRGSLGELENLAARLAEVQKKVPPQIRKKLVTVFAADHGVAHEGVSLYPQEVTSQMVANFVAGGAAINVLARHLEYDVKVIDAGIVTPVYDEAKPSWAHGGVESIGICRGSGNIAREDALSDDQVDRAIAAGERLAAQVSADGYDLAAIGDMGIANTTVAAAVLAAGGFAVEDVVDRGTGIDDATLSLKEDVVNRAVRRLRASAGDNPDPRTIVRMVGGPDFAMMMGFILGLRGQGVACMLDGFPVTAAAYLAAAEDPGAKRFLFAGHRSKVRGHAVVLKSLGLEPLVDFKMRLGEGTGAVIGGKIVELAAALSAEMATFSSAGVSESGADEENY